MNINILPENFDSSAQEYRNLCSFYGLLPVYTLPIHQSDSCLDHTMFKYIYKSIALSISIRKQLLEVTSDRDRWPYSWSISDQRVLVPACDRLQVVSYVGDNGFWWRTTPWSRWAASRAVAVWRSSPKRTCESAITPTGFQENSKAMIRNWYATMPR